VLKPRLIKILRFKLNKRFILIGALYALILVFFWLHASAAAAVTIDSSAKKDENKKIRITADKLNAMIDAGEIEFIGNVRATQANTVVTADRLKIIYTPVNTQGHTGTPQPESIEKIIAQGRVKIVHGDIIAEADMAEYTMKSAVLVLTGERSNVTQGGHSISGTKFTLYRLNGQITVESNEKNRVKAVFESSEKDK
jgi:lipopolysaccharide export system protein LptA